MTEALVDTVCDFTGLRKDIDRELILHALAAKSNDTQAVVAEFYEDEAKFRDTYTWNVMAFMADREGNFQNSSYGAPTFSIQAPDDTGSVIHGATPARSVPPSRPPSRSDNRSPLSNMAKWASETAGAPSSRAQEVADLERALQESAAESGIQLPLQESGVTGGSNSSEDAHMPYFGPALRENYEQNQWAMVPVNVAKPDPSPSERKRAPGIPAFLRTRKIGNDQHRLGALLTIYHEIPAARNFFLEIGTPAASYGINNQWWKGDLIMPPPKDVATLPEDEEWTVQEPTGPRPGFIEELHRIMAFLDITDRSYGTGDIIGDICTEPTRGFLSVESQFFEALKEWYAAEPERRRQLFWGVQLFPFSGTPVPEPEQTERFGIFEMNFYKASYERMVTLYDAWDELFWIDFYQTGDEESMLRTAAITEVGDILTMTFAGEGGLVRPMEIPGEFYIDRYLAENRAVSMEQQLRIRQCRRRLDEIDDLERKFSKWWSAKDGEWKEKIPMSKRVIDDRIEKEKELKFRALRRRWFECVDTPDYFYFIPGWMDDKIAFSDDERTKLKQWESDRKLHEALIEEITSKAAEFAKLRGDIEAEIAKERQKNTVPCAEEDWKPTHKYCLRGVIPTPNVIYLAQRAEPDLIEMEGNLAPTDQWWRLSYDAEDRENPLRIATSSLDEARKVAYKESTTPFLIFANDAAMDAMPKTLSETLRTFVKFDNRVFKQELIEQRPSSPAAPDVPRKPTLPSRDATPLGAGRRVRTSSMEVFPDTASNESGAVEMTEVRLDMSEPEPSRRVSSGVVHWSDETKRN